MKAAALVFALLLAACTTPGAQPRAATVATTRFGETVRLGPLELRPVSLVEDSRCPADVQCVWAGRLVIIASVGEGTGEREVQLTLGIPRLVDGTAITLVAASPAPIAGRPVREGDYRLAFSYVDAR